MNHHQSVVPPSAQPTVDQHNRFPALSQLTIEEVLWILVVAVAFALRLAKLNATLLSGSESWEALTAWQAITIQGDMPTSGTGYSPLLFAANAFLFALCGASDTVARLVPAICGATLVFTPFFLRHHIGRVGALATGLYLALSPTFLFASRQADGTALAVLAGMMLLVGVVRFIETGSRTWVSLSAATLAIGFASHSTVYGLLVSLGLAGLGSAWLWPTQESHQPVFWEQLRKHLKHALVVFLLTFLAFSTAFGWNLGGFGDAGDLLPAWVARFGSIGSSSVPSPFVLLSVYEPLALLFGIGGAVWAIRRAHRSGIVFALWAGVGTLLLLFMPGRMALDVSWTVLPLSMLLGTAVEQLSQRLRERGEWLNEGLHIPIVVLLWIHLYLMLTRYAVFRNPSDLALALLALALQVLLALIFGLAMRLDAALRAVVTGTGIALFATTLSVAWRVAYVRPSDPRELLVSSPTAVEVSDLLETLHDLSWRETRFPLTLPIVYEEPPDSAVLRWYLRDFTDAYYVETLHTEDFGQDRKDGTVVLSTDPTWQAEEWGHGSDAYAGQDFVLHRTWNHSEVRCTWDKSLDCYDVIRWALLRESPSPPQADRWAILWVIGDSEGGGPRYKQEHIE